MVKGKSNARFWVQDLIVGMEFPGYPNRNTAVELVSKIFGSYVDLEKRIAEINTQVFQNFTFSTAEQLFESLAQFESRNLNRKNVLDLAALYMQQYFTGSMGPDTHVNLEGAVPFAPDCPIHK